tara:strand:+ start:2929 stop:3936 length:1008 start_codon:yes stop_codon:yes gene_type:complete
LKIDIHNHIIPETWPDLEKKFGYSGWVHLKHHPNNSAEMVMGNESFRTIACNCWDPVVRMKDCDFNSVDVQVLSTIPVMFSYWAEPKDALFLSKILNDHISKVVHDNPKRFLGLGTIPMQDIDLAISELDRCMAELNLSGVQIGSNINGKNLSDPSLHPIFSAAQDLDASIFIHPWNMFGEREIKKYWLPWLVGMPAETSRAICSMIFGGIFEKFPNLNVAFAHGGGSFLSTIGRIQHGFVVRPDLLAIDNSVDPMKYLGEFWVDSLVHDIDMLELLIKKVGHKKIALGSDYPFPLGENNPGLLIDLLNIEQKFKEDIFFKNALDWLNLPHDHFK